MATTTHSTFTEAHDKARTRSMTSRSRWHAIMRLDHPHVAGPYYYAISADDKHAWTPGEVVLATYDDGEAV